MAEEPSTKRHCGETSDQSIKEEQSIKEDDVQVPGEKRDYTTKLDKVELHGKETLEVVCTSKPDKAEEMISRLWRKAGGLYPRFVGVDAEYTREEIKATLDHIGDLKAPGPDGLHAVFYKRFWHIIGEDLIDEVLLAVNNRKIPEGWNNTTIVLIPKVRNPQNITKYRPISLCNVLYKICSKVLANRLKEILDEIIAEEQSAFVPGRLITDNILVAL